MRSSQSRRSSFVRIKRLLRASLSESALAYVHAGYWAYRLRTGAFHEEEFDFLGRFVSEGQTCLDIGSNFGQYAVQLATLVGKTGTVICFEPVAYTRSVLVKVLRILGHRRRVSLYTCALGNEQTLVSMAIPRNRGGDINLSEAHIAMREQVGTEEVPCRRLDDIEEIRSGSKIGFIKCDVEGAELMVLRGAEALIQRSRPVLLCEVEERHTQRYGYTPSDVFDLVRRWGYSAYVIQEGALVRVDGHQPEENNYFFISQTEAVIS